MRPPFRILAMALLLLAAGCGDRAEHAIQGYIEGDYRYPAAPIAGRLLEQPVRRGQSIRAGDMLAQLEDAEERLHVEQLAAAVELAQLEADRRQALIDSRTISVGEWDQARLALEQMRRQHEEAIWRLGQKRIVAPCDGFIHDTYFEVGDVVPAGRPVVALLPPDARRARFYLAASKTETLRVGGVVRVRPGGNAAEAAATITFVSDRPEYTPPVIYSRDRRDKLVYLIEARLPDSEAARFHPGQPVEIEIAETANGRE